LKAFEKAAKKAHKKIERIPEGKKFEKWISEMGKALKDENLDI